MSASRVLRTPVWYTVFTKEKSAVHNPCWTAQMPWGEPFRKMDEVLAKLFFGWACVGHKRKTVSVLYSTCERCTASVRRRICQNFGSFVLNLDVAHGKGGWEAKLRKAGASEEGSRNFPAGKYPWLGEEFSMCSSSCFYEFRGGHICIILNSCKIMQVFILCIYGNW